GLSVAEVEGALFQLCRTGKAMYDLATRQYRLRELFAESLPDELLVNADPRLGKAQQLFVNGHVRLTNTVTKGRYKETTVTARVTDGTTERDVTVSISEDGRIRFGRCDCPFFEANLLARGPCEHILAVRLAAEAAPTTSESASVATNAATSDDDDESDEVDEDEDDDESDDEDDDTDEDESDDEDEDSSEDGDIPF
ncbi:MAG TPA: SWIM zinc finger family protein, partial [Ktedonobacterales bacterium]|nr:SWIM zinc finger family protein [Ktedonobacterales bacterium]